MRTAEPLRGISASFRRAAKRSSAGRFRSSAIAFKRLRLAACCAVNFRRRLFFSIELVLAIHCPPKAFRGSRVMRSRGPLAAEREVETTKQLARFVVSLGRGANDHIEAHHL